MRETAEKPSALYRLAVWYGSKPAIPRKAIVMILVPAMEYLILVPLVTFLNFLVQLNRAVAVAALPLVLFAICSAVLVICLFVWEAFQAKIKNKIFACMYLACVFAWVLAPIRFLT